MLCAMKARLYVVACRRSAFLWFYEKPRLSRQRWPANFDRIEAEREEGPKRHDSMFWTERDKDLRPWLVRLHDLCTQAAFMENDGLCSQLSWQSWGPWLTSFFGTTPHRARPLPHPGEISLEVAVMQRSP